MPHKKKSLREIELQQALDDADPRAVVVCQFWHSNFGKLGWGSLEFVQEELSKATQAICALKDLLCDKATILKMIKEQVEQEISENLSISYDSGDISYGHQSPKTITLKYKDKGISTDYVE